MMGAVIQPGTPYGNSAQSILKSQGSNSPAIADTNQPCWPAWHMQQPMSSFRWTRIIHAIGKMLLAYEAGSDLVLGVRSDRTSDTVTKRGTAGAYYKILSLLGVNIVENHAD